MYINDFSMYQCILVCVCVYVDVHLYIYIYILTYVHGFLMDIWMHIVRLTSMNLLICVYYIYIYIYISYIYIYRIYTYFPTPNSPSNWSHFLWTRHQASTNTFATSTLAVSTSFCGSKMFQVNSVVLLGFAVNQWLSFPCQPLFHRAARKKLRFSLALQMGTPLHTKCNSMETP